MFLRPREPTAIALQCKTSCKGLTKAKVFWHMSRYGLENHKTSVRSWLHEWHTCFRNMSCSLRFLFMHNGIIYTTDHLRMSKIYILYTTGTTEVMISPSRQSLLTKRMLGFISPWIYETLKSCKKLISTTQGSPHLKENSWGMPNWRTFGFNCCGMHQMPTGIQGNQLKQFSRKVSTLCIFQSSAQLLASLARVCKRQASQFQLQEAIRSGSNMLDWVTKCWTSWRKTQKSMMYEKGPCKKLCKKHLSQEMK